MPKYNTGSGSSSDQPKKEQPKTGQQSGQGQSQPNKAGVGQTKPGQSGVNQKTNTGKGSSKMSGTKSESAYKTSSEDEL
ncbi:MAG: hypothetical protein PHY93_05590 [Bacteriovorax sp.]|nr:hypothetical protein [Bacteriovorax sp.]